jgi:phytanoyl-CoA hydroxylase
MQHKKKFKENGYLILRNFFSAEYINLIKEQSEKIFQIQFDRFGYKDTFTNNIIKLFEEQNEIFINCGKIIQTGLIELYKLPLEKKLINKIKTLGLSFPNLCTRPVLFFNHGSIIIWPKTHKLGPLPYNSVGGFASVKIEGETIQPKLNVGDIVIFSTLLVHSSGEITNNTIRWSCHYRFTNMEEIDFIKRGFPNPYVYKPITK